MKKIIGNLFFSCLFCFLAKGQPPLYSLANVPETIKNKASVITHLENYDLEVESLDKASLSVHKIFTVVNEEGKGSLLFFEYTTKYISLDDVEIRVYDSTGKQTGKFKKKDMSSTITGEGLIEEGNVTYYRIPAISYPVTVDIK